jgi:hypothetical protein
VATLARLYPLLLLVALLRRGEWALVAACATTMVLGYWPFILLSQGDIRAVLFSFSEQRNLHPGVLDMTPFYLVSGAGIQVGLMAVLVVTHVLETFVVGMTVLLVCLQRCWKRMSVEVAALILFAVVLMVYAHVFPWYVTVLLPWIALLAKPVWTRENGLSAQGLAVAMVWYFTCIVVLSYFPGMGQYFTASNWLIYYGVSFGVLVAGLAVAAVIGWQH